jgi:hypothetical protein
VFWGLVLYAALFCSTGGEFLSYHEVSHPR